MFKKLIKPLIITGAVSAVLVGCSQEKELAPGSDKTEKAQEVASEDVFKVENYYGKKDSEVLVEINGEKLTVGEVKEDAFKQLLLTEVNQFIEKQLLLEKYPISDETLKKEIEKYAGTTDIDKEQLRFQLAYDKAVRDGVEITEADLKEIYNTNFKNSGRTYKEMKAELEQMAPYYKGANVYEKLASLRKGADTKFVDEKLGEQVNSLFAAPQQSQESAKTTEEKSENN